MSEGKRVCIQFYHFHFNLRINLPQCWSEHGGNCYKFFPQQRTWDSARSTCIELGGDLALPIPGRKTSILVISLVIMARNKRGLVLRC